jgi:hypothetical protein
MAMNTSIERGPGGRLLAATLVLGLSVAGPIGAAPGHSTLSGVVRSGDGNTPLSGARVLAGDVATGEVYPSLPTGEDGTFEISDLRPATYSIAVESNSGLYLVEQAVPLAAGANQAVGISVDPSMNAANGGGGKGKSKGKGGKDDDDPGAVPPTKKGRRPQIWNNPLTASLAVFGLAVIFGLVIENATDDTDAEKPATPTGLEL